MLRLLSLALLLSTMSLNGAAASPTGGAASNPAADEPFARVGETIITRQQFREALHRTVRGRFYHGTAPEGQMAAVRQEVADGVIDRALLLQEAERRGITADPDEIEERLQQYEAQYSDNPAWNERREAVLPVLRAHFEQEDVLEQLEARVQEIAPPSEDALRAYYAKHPDQFTEPERIRVSLILLGVDPSSGAEVWQGTFSEAAALVSDLRAGADFAETARQRSDDRSSTAGGDMGYLHRGMLNETVDAALADLELGGVSDPVRVLEGIAIFQVQDRQPSRLMPFERVRDRAQDLWLREQGEQAWTALKERLRENTPIIVFDQTFSGGDDGL